jgi:Na+-driven multidrug efflux pump
MTPSTRILVNTLASYARLCVLALVGILATPIILHILGATDFGIFSVIAGSLAFLMFINGALTTGAQRHIAYSLGQGKSADAAKWFTASLIVHVSLGAILGIVAIFATHGVLYHVLNMPPARLAAAAWIYRMVIITMVLNIVSTPFQAMMMAHESIVMLSLINILSALTTIVGAFALRFLPGDALIWYAAIYGISQIILFLGPMLYGVYRYRECRQLAPEGMQRRNLAELLSFSGWNLFGALAAVIRSQGPALLINVFMGAAMNAAYGLAIQANGFSSEISWGVLRATTSPIVKRHASGDSSGMASLSNLANKYAFIILWVVIAPVLFEVGFCLKLWLKHVPSHTTAFVCLLLSALLIDQLTSGFGASLQATGKIASYQMVVGTMNCIAIPVGYFLFKAGLPAESILWAGIGGATLAGCCRLWFAKTRAHVPVAGWLSDVLLPCGICVVVSSIVMVLITRNLEDGFVRFGLVLLANFITVGLLMWRFGTTDEHKAKLVATGMLRLRRNRAAA